LLKTTGKKNPALNREGESKQQTKGESLFFDHKRKTSDVNPDEDKAKK